MKLIDPATGNLCLPNGLTVQPWTWKEHLQKDLQSAGLEARQVSIGYAAYAEGSLWWDFEFQHERLRRALLWTLVGEPDQWTPEAGEAWKRRHDRLLMESLGEPHARRIQRRSWFSKQTLEFLEWTFRWGTVISGFEGRDFEPQIEIEWR